MKTLGDKTTFDHVQSLLPTEQMQQHHAMFIVFFDGDRDIWFSRLPKPDTLALDDNKMVWQIEINKCLAELTEYYQRDWKGTGRTISVLYTGKSLYTTIDCL